MRHTIKSTIELDVTVIAHISKPVPPIIHPVDNADPGDPGERYVESVLLHKSGLPGLDITQYLSEEDLEYLAQEALEDLEDRD